jgi:D-glycero-alpha-D-manno-heptose-7-phosphate kinase
MLIVRSPVRISFGGGGTDLPAYYKEFGGAVLSTSINKYFYTVLCRRSDGKVQVISSDLRAIETWRDITRMRAEGTDLEIPLAVLKELGSDVSVDLFLASEIPPGTGLGSSASVCVNVLKTISTYVNKPLSKYELAEKAFHIAREVLKKPVGKQDEYAAAFGGLNFIEFQSDGTTQVTPLDLNPGLVSDLESSLMLFFVGATHQSWHILREQESNTRDNEGMAREALHEIRRLADRMCNSLNKGDLVEFGGLLDESWRAKKQVSAKITNSHIDELYQLARAGGALGGKITGAGGGGFLMLCCEPQHQDAVRRALAPTGTQEMAFAFDNKGAQVVVNDPFVDGDDRCGPQWLFVPAYAKPSKMDDVPKAVVRAITSPASTNRQ